MSVLIRGMKMPENCVGCPLAKNYGMCAITKKQFNWGNPNRLSDCPLIEILPHGRLIDADRLVRELKNIMSEEDPHFAELMYIVGQPTIIEAEGK